MSISPTSHTAPERNTKSRLTAAMAALSLLAATFLGAAAVSIATADEVHAAPRVSISGPDGTATVSASGNTDITVSGSGFQSIQGGFGGIYVFFGWVNDPAGGSWKPSQGGRTGEDLLYVPDTEARDNAGYQRFTTFPGSGTSSAANGGTLAADGTWSLRMRTPGARFNAQDRQGNEREVDCTQVQCGIITIGAHGVVNPANESFTPVSFTGTANSEPVRVQTDSSASQSNRDQSDASQSSTDGAAEGGTLANPQQSQVDAISGAQETEETGPEPTDEDSESDDSDAAASGIATIGLQQQTVQAGRTLGFTGQGFEPGEQVVVTLAGGSTGAGPLLAGEFGEVAGAVPVDAELLPGTHLLRIAGAGSGQQAEAEFTIAANPLAAVTEEGTSGWSWGLLAVLIVGGLILLFVIISLVMSLIRRHRAKKAAENEAAWAAYDAYHGTGLAETAESEPVQEEPAIFQEAEETEAAEQPQAPEQRRRRRQTESYPTETMEAVGTAAGGNG